MAGKGGLGDRLAGWRKCFLHDNKTSRSSSWEKIARKLQYRLTSYSNSTKNTAGFELRILERRRGVFLQSSILFSPSTSTTERNSRNVREDVERSVRSRHVDAQFFTRRRHPQERAWLKTIYPDVLSVYYPGFVRMQCLCCARVCV